MIDNSDPEIDYKAHPAGLRRETVWGGAMFKSSDGIRGQMLLSILTNDGAPVTNDSLHNFITTLTPCEILTFKTQVKGSKEIGRAPSLFKDFDGVRMFVPGTELHRTGLERTPWYEMNLGILAENLNNLNRMINRTTDSGSVWVPEIRYARSRAVDMLKRSATYDPANFATTLNEILNVTPEGHSFNAYLNGELISGFGLTEINGMQKLTSAMPYIEGNPEDFGSHDVGSDKAQKFISDYAKAIIDNFGKEGFAFNIV